MRCGTFLTHGCKHSVYKYWNRCNLEQRVCTRLLTHSRVPFTGQDNLRKDTALVHADLEAEETRQASYTHELQECLCKISALLLHTEIAVNLWQSLCMDLDTPWHKHRLRIFSAWQHICYSALYTITRPSVRLSHGWISQRRLKLGSCKLHRRVTPWL